MSYRKKEVKKLLRQIKNVIDTVSDITDKKELLYMLVIFSDAVNREIEQDELGHTN